MFIYSQIIRYTRHHFKIRDYRVPVSEHERLGCFATFFAEKVSVVTNSTVIDPLVFDGKKQIDASNLMFMSTNEVRKCRILCNRFVCYVFLLCYDFMIFL